MFIDAQLLFDFTFLYLCLGLFTPVYYIAHNLKIEVSILHYLCSLFNARISTEYRDSVLDLRSVAQFSMSPILAI